MNGGNLYFKRLIILTALFGTLIFTCGFRIKARSIYPTEVRRDDVQIVKQEEYEEESLENDTVSQEPERNERPEETTAYSTPSEVVEDNGADIFLVGDSRTVYACVDTKDKRANWLAACGTSYEYFTSHYIPILDAADLNGKKIVILYGVNDIGYYGKETACANWIGFYKTRAQEWIKRGAEVYACSVLGFNYRAVSNGTGLSHSDLLRMNTNVDEYNSLVESLLPSNIGYIRIGFSTEEPLRDGVHYSVEEDFRIYGGIIDHLSR